MGHGVRIAAVHMTPQWADGAEAALIHSLPGLRERAEHVDLVVPTKKSGSTRHWTERARQHATIEVNPWKDDIGGLLSEYNGTFINDPMLKTDDPLAMTLVSSFAVAPWTTARHWNNVSKVVTERYGMMTAAPRWSKRIVTFWPSAENVDGIEWVRAGALPYVRNPLLADLAPVSQRPVDFACIGRSDPKKGTYAFAATMEALTRLDSRPFTAAISGVPADMMGGPHIYEIAQALEGWGWKLDRETEKRKSNWTATKAGSTIWHTGAYDPSDLPKILGRVKCVMYSTVAKYSSQKLEYASLEALDAGCMLFGPTDWPDNHYGGDGQGPIVTEIPDRSWRPRKGKRILNLDRSPEAPSTTYAPSGEVLSRALDLFRDPDCDDVTGKIAEYNRSALDVWHDPVIAADAYLTALGLR